MQQRISHWSGPAGQHVLEMASRPLGALAPHEVLVKVLATSLNYRDLLVRATPAEAGAAPVVPLSDGSGIVVATGSAVRRWKVGDRVTPGFFRDWHDGPYRLPYLASARGGPGVDGMLVDLMVAGENELVATPAHLSAAEAATLPCAWLTAWHALFERGQLAAGETVLVQGTGGVAMAALQLAVAHGARVLVLSRSESKCARACHGGMANDPYGGVPGLGPGSAAPDRRPGRGPYRGTGRAGHLSDELASDRCGRTHRPDWRAQRL